MMCLRNLNPRLSGSYLVHLSIKNPLRQEVFYYFLTFYIYYIIIFYKNQKIGIKPEDLIPMFNGFVFLIQGKTLVNSKSKTSKTYKRKEVIPTITGGCSWKIGADEGNRNLITGLEDRNTNHCATSAYYLRKYHFS